MIYEWVVKPSPHGQNILWVHGPAGSGKSTVAKTVVRSFEKLGRRGAYLLFQRNQSSPDTVVRTLTYQLASFHAEIATSICEGLERAGNVNMGISEDVELLLEALKGIVAAPGPVVIVLDGLDECGDRTTRRQLLTAIVREFSQLPSNYRVIITSRPEDDIERRFSSVSHILPVPLDVDSTDVETYIHRELAELRENENNLDWTTHERQLSTSAGGLFIWASTALELLLASDDVEFMLEKLTSKSSVSMQGMYHLALDSSGIDWTNERSRSRFTLIVGLILFAKLPLSETDIDGLLGEMGNPYDSLRTLRYLRSVLKVEAGQPVGLLHASFGDYLTGEPQRGEPWFLYEFTVHEHIASRCFIIMELLQFNICEFPSSYLRNEQVLDLSERIEKNIPSELQYACRFWGDHLAGCPWSDRIADHALKFLHTKFLFWIEVLSLLKALSVAPRALSCLITWMNVSAFFHKGLVRAHTAFRQL